MRFTVLVISLSAILFAAHFASAQPPAAGRGDGSQASGVDAFVAKLMAFDKNKDGKLTKDEITDERLLPLFERADANHDGIVTVEELKALFAKEGAGLAGGPGGDRGGPGGRPDAGPGGGRPGPGGPRQPPQPGQILPARLQDALKLTDEQKKDLAELQKTVDAQLDKILTDDQKKQLADVRNRRPGPPQ